MGRINVAIVGLGNCASSLIQGIHKYVEVPADAEIPDVMRNGIGDYRTEAIDVARNMVEARIQGEADALAAPPKSGKRPVEEPVKEGTA